MNFQPKYELTTEVTRFYNTELYRIRALKDFADVKAGDLGGFVQSEANLSQFDNCWLYDEAKALANSQVLHDATLFDNSWAGGDASVYDDAVLKLGSSAYGHATVCGNAVLEGANITGHATAMVNAKIKNVLVASAAYVSEDTCTINPISIGGLTWPITVTDTKLRIGCECHAFHEWQHFSDAQIHQMHSAALNFWNKNKTFIFTLINTHRNKLQAVA